MMKYVAIVIIAVLVLVLVGCGSKSDTESVYRTKLDTWTRRLTLNAAMYNSPGALIDAWQIQQEIDDTLPPHRYTLTHKHLREAISLYVGALAANQRGDDMQTIYLLNLFKKAMTAAKNAI